MKGRIILAGGSGFLGTLLCRHLARSDWDVIVLTRDPGQSNDRIKQVEWDGSTRGPWVEQLSGASALINLAGRSVNCRYTPANRQMILESRVGSTRVLGEALGHCSRPPPVWLNSSTATIYRHSVDRPMYEATGEIGAMPEAKDAFSVEVARAWEKALADACVPRTRKVALRTAMVLGTGEQGVLSVLRRLACAGLGGRMGSGEQVVSWIHEADFCRAIEWLIVREAFYGVVNVAAPAPVPNRELMRRLRDACGSPFGLPATRWMLELGAFFMRTETELILKSRRVVPGRLLAAGFQFRFPTLPQALSDLIPKMAG